LTAAGVRRVVTIASGASSLLTKLFAGIELVQLSPVPYWSHQLVTMPRRPTALVAPDDEAYVRVAGLGSDIGVPVVRISKRRLGPESVTAAAVGRIDGLALEHAVIVDDLITSAGTVEATAVLLRQLGAGRVSVVTTHLRPTETGLRRLTLLRSQGLVRRSTAPTPPVTAPPSTACTSHPA